MDELPPPSDQPSPKAGFSVLAVLSWLAAAAAVKLHSTWVSLLVLLLVPAAIYVGRYEKGRVAKIVALLALVYPGWDVGETCVTYLFAHQDAAIISELVTSEEQLLELTPNLGQLSQSLMNLRLPDAPRRGLFEPTVTVVGLAGGGESLPSATGKLTAMQPEKVEHLRRRSVLSLWRPLLDHVSWFEHAHFSFIKGRFLDKTHSTFEADVGFSGLAKMKSGEWRGLNGKQTILWRRGSAGEWRISGWEMRQMSAASSPKRFFHESLAQVLPRSSDYRNMRRSEHHEATIKFYQGGSKTAPHPYYAPISANQKPGLAIVDVDCDGDDDIYVTVRIGRNKLLENQGDGTFVEAAAKYGLDFTGHSTCALFADFDNDGDPDLVLGRSLLPSLYFENRNGRFAHVQQATDLPRLAISLSAADYNGDGLLDFYLLTYRPATIGDGENLSGGVADQVVNWPDEFLTPEQAEEYYEHHKAANSEADPLFPNLLNQVGPPNVLYVNRGNGRFEPAEENLQLGIWRNSLQATWADFDEDGDPDVYVANDWAPDSFFRNDGDGGFREVADELATNAFGFAMGVSWGDYDNDGLQDLYVSNMYSKAGRRITDRLTGLSEIYRQSAAGNYLYRQRQGRSFQLVSGEFPPDLTVANAGWSWGGQFADFDNDGFLDLYVLSGYFTAPKAVSSDLDL
ncbi:MAG: VCBS repeat-containing protein [Planctomycetales bacterium]|nr:VCBS repeat-containing protein [Planctomycetales bacterium]